MNAGVVEPSRPSELPSPGESWSRRKFYSVILLVLLAHIAFIFVFGATKPIVPRAVGPVPQLQLAAAANELIALGDPTLFALPQANDFASAVWLRQLAITPPSFAYTEPPQFLPLPVEKLGATFTAFVATNQFADFQFNFKPEPLLVVANSVFNSPLPTQSTFHIAGELAARPLLNAVAVPSLPLNDVLVPSRVQALVDVDGNVISTVLLDSSGNETADQLALKLTRNLRFAPANQMAFGEVIFHWHTIPAPTP